MSTTSRVAGAVAAGYALGRFKKLRLAVLVATAMSNPKLRAAATGMLQDRLPGGAITGAITKEVGGRLVTVGKSAATSLVASRIDSLSQSLAERSEGLRKGTGGQAGKSRADKSADDGSEEPTDEYEEQEGEEAEEPEDKYEEQEAEEPEDEYEEQEAEEPEDEYEEQEAEEPEDEYEEQESEEPEEPTDEYEDQEAEEPADEAEEPDAAPDEEPEEPVARSPRRRRSASPAGRRRG
jgi:hypothetical protein